MKVPSVGVRHRPRESRRAGRGRFGRAYRVRGARPDRLPAAPRGATCSPSYEMNIAGVRGPRAPLLRDAPGRPSRRRARSIRLRRLLAHRSRRRLGGRARRRDPRLRAGDPARGPVGPVAARRAPGRCSPPASGASCCGCAWEYGAGARGWVILSSRDSRARPRLRPARARAAPVGVRGRRPRQGATAPRGLRASGGADDLPLTAAVDRAVRGAAHGEDLLAAIASGPRAAACCRSAATPSCATGSCACSRPSTRTRRARLLRGVLARAEARRPARRRRVDHLGPGVGDRRLPRGRAGAPYRHRRGVPGRRRRPVPALPAERCLPLISAGRLRFPS